MAYLDIMNWWKKIQLRAHYRDMTSHDIYPQAQNDTFSFIYIYNAYERFKKNSQDVWGGGLRDNFVFITFMVD